MNGAAAVSADPMGSKILLALVSALISWCVKAVWDEFTQRRRWRRIAPLVLRQLAEASRSCADALDASGLPRAVMKLDAAQKSAVEIVAAGVQVEDWIAGLQAISDLLDSAQIVEAVAPNGKGEALSNLRARARALESWVCTMPSTAGGRLRRSTSWKDPNRPVDDAATSFAPAHPHDASES